MPLTKNELIFLHDPRSVYSNPSYKDLIKWKSSLRRFLFMQTKGRSVLTLKPLSRGFHIHEGIIPRAVAPKSVENHWRIFSGPNCFVLDPEEHIPEPPSRALCYWISVIRYGQLLVDTWIQDLPFKVQIDAVWKTSELQNMLKSIPDKMEVDPLWHSVYGKYI